MIKPLSSQAQLSPALELRTELSLVVSSIKNGNELVSSVDRGWCEDWHSGGFHLHLLVFPFIYQLNSRIGVLVNSSFANY